MKDSIYYMQLGDTYLLDTYAHYPVVIEKGHGAIAYDIEGKKYIDFGSGIGVNCLGYTHDKYTKAIVKQAKKISHISNLYYSPVNIELAKKLTSITKMKRVFFANSGAEANEGATKLARKYSTDKYGTHRTTILTLSNSFHGRTITTLSATGQDHFHEHFQPLTDGFKYVKTNDIESVKAGIDDTICAIMIELIQGEGGVNLLDKEFVDGIKKIAKKKDILIIADEVQTGVMRTGKFLACEYFGLKPDILTLAKGLGGGLPVGAVLCGEKCENVFKKGQHGSTFGGNPIVSAGALEVLKIVNKKGFADEVFAKGEYIRNELAKIDNISNIRGLGLMIAFDVKDKDVKELAKQMVAEGLLILTAKTSLRLLPPLIISYEEIDKGLNIIKKVLSK